MKRATWLTIGGLVLVVGVIGVSAGSLWSGLPVDVAEVREGPIQEFVDERGKTRLPETHLVTMPFGGRVEAITLSEGDEVQKGEIVAQLVPLDLDLTVEEARAVVERLEAAIRENAYSAIEETAVKQAEQFVESMRNTVLVAETRLPPSIEKSDYHQKNLKRVEELAKTKAQSEDELDRARLDAVQAKSDLAQDGLVVEATRALALATDMLPTMVRQYIERKSFTEAVLKKQLAEATARLRQVEQNQKRGTMTSPVDGVVLDRPVTNEQFLPAGTELLEIGRLEDLEVDAEVLSVDVVNVKEGAPVEIYGPAIGKNLPGARDYAVGTVHRVYPAGFTKISSLGVEQQRVIVIIHFKPEDLQWLRAKRGLGVGYRVRVRIRTREAPSALVIPRSSLFRGADGQWNVYAIRGGRARVAKVQIGILNDELAQVTDGLAPGDLIVRAPEGDLEDGQRVKAVVEESEEPPGPSAGTQEAD
ncbi:MAG TPA: HlyD family efflux transporter periplasmic adaptor subunit [Thermoguttaceae bacterium]|nr:HlyD family efflux transporter periplasmic adaptor subunit [Thermoguttaceae bacterium]